MITAVIGKNFGDEGKGLAVDYFCGLFPRCTVVKHNGGAQAGHTVVFNGKRFVFHQLSSGSFRGAETYFASTYYPDFFKLRKEIADFGNNPGVFCCADTPLIYIDDVLINMALEQSRGDSRHGSCGMGINEGFVRTQAQAGLYARDIFGKSVRSLVKKMAEIRCEYGRKRLAETGLYGHQSEYMELLETDSVLINAAEEMARAAESITPVDDEAEFLKTRENIVFETGQGLLLDSENETYAPHVTASRTGLHNISLLLKKSELTLDECCYVTRTYVTRHGAGSLPFETARETIGRIGIDLTNIHNDWQGSIRYGKHKDIADFIEPIYVDLRAGKDIYNDLFGCGEKQAISLFITHLNETDSKVVFSDGAIHVDEFLAHPDISGIIGRHYLSYAEENQ